MNDFFERYARQSHESGAAKTFLRLARIATGLRWQGRGLGGQFLAAAARRCLRAAAEVGGVVFLIDASNGPRGPLVHRLRRCTLEQQAFDARSVALEPHRRPESGRAVRTRH